jgi:hypothetical protein
MARAIRLNFKMGGETCQAEAEVLGTSLRSGVFFLVVRWYEDLER